MNEPLATRNRAALAHLSLFPVLTWIWLPLLLRRADPDNDFLVRHTTGAAVFQGTVLLSIPVCWFLGLVSTWTLSEVTSKIFLVFYGTVLLCLAGAYVLGAIALAFQAWNGDPFWAPWVSYLLGYDEPSEE